MNKALLAIAALWLLTRKYRQAVTEIIMDVSLRDINSVRPLTVLIQNSNVTPFYISKADLDLFATIGGTTIKIADIVTDEVYLPGNGTVEVSPFIVYDTEALLRATTALLTTNSIPVTVTGTVNIGPLELPVDFTKPLSIQEITNN